MRNFSARETEWLQELDGIELAGFWRRAFAFVFDWVLISILLSAVVMLGVGVWVGIRHLQGKPTVQIINSATGSNDKDYNFTVGPSGYEAFGDKRKSTLEKVVDDVTDVVVPVLYFGILLWKGKGRTPGKRLMKIRVISIVHRHLSFWHSIERALGYGAAALELGFGFLQFFIHPYRRCAQDRLAETIVVTESSYQALQHRLSHPLIPDGAPDLQPDEQPTAR